MRATLLGLLMTVLFGAPLLAQGGVTTRIKDITFVGGTAGNQLTGMGLITGLKGTGDKTDMEAAKMHRAIQDAFKSTKGAKDEDFLSANIARVFLTAFVDEGTTVAGTSISVIVSAVSDKTKSLEGGTLSQSSLVLHRGGETVATAGGLLTTVKKSGPGQGGGNNQGAMIVTANGTLVDNLVIPFFSETTLVDDKGVARTVKKMKLGLTHPDEGTAKEIARAINETRDILGETGVKNGAVKQLEVAKAIGIGEIEVEIPSRWHGSEVEFRAMVGSVSVNPDTVAMVVVNETTGVVVVTGAVRLSPGSIFAAGVTITVGADGNLPKKPAPGAEAKDPGVAIGAVNNGVQELVDVLNALNLSGADKIAIFRALNTAKLLQGKLVETK